MEIDDILKYSQQFIAFFKDDRPKLFNGFFLQSKWYTYLITVNHGMAIDFNQADKIYFVLHANSEGLSTRAVEIKTWHFIDLFKFPEEGVFEFPFPDERVDFAYCIVDKKDFEGSLKILPFIIQGADPSSCRRRTIHPILFPEKDIVPSECKKYYLAGKIMAFVNDANVVCRTYFYGDMNYMREWDGLYEFHINQPSSIDDWAGLSGSPVFDEDENFMGMALRYREEDNVLRVLPACEIADYL